jgi:hypothetical protein
MNRSRGNISVPIFALLSVLLTGCAGNALQLPGLQLGGGGNGVELERTPFVLPSVVAMSSTNQNVSKFLMNVSVKNYTEKAAPKLWLKAHSEYFATVNKEQLCEQTEWIAVDPLPPGKSWTLAAYPIDKFSDCKCLRPKCTGSLWLSLHPKQGATKRLPGSNTALLVHWLPDGKIQNMTVDEF